MPDANKRRFPSIPRSWANRVEMEQRTVDQLRLLQQGKTNNVFEITLAAAPATTTTLAHPIIGPESEALYGAKSASAATELGGGAFWYEREAGLITFHHSSSAAVDRTLSVLVVG